MTTAIAAYLRVSTSDQHTGSQRAEIEKYLVNSGISLDSVTWYEDKETGTTLKRPAFERLQKDIFRGKVKTVIVWKLDRVSRNLRDGVNVLADWAEQKLKVVVVTLQLEFNGAIGRTIAALMSGLAEIEHDNIKARQAAGIAAARLRGVYLGRRRGSSKAKPERARALAARGLHNSEIATALGVSERTVTRYLRLAVGAK